MAFPVTFYKSSAENERVDKTNYLSDALTKNLEGVYNIDVERPILRISSFSPIGYNYCYITEFDKYYFIESKNYNQGIWELQLDEDSLMSFKDDILKQKAIISKQESNPINKYYNDGTYKNEEKTFHKVIEFDDLFELGFDYIVTTIGGFPINQPV